MNVCTFVGRLGRDAETRETKNGDQVTGFSLASNVGYGENKSTVWLDCSIWGNRGATLQPALVKGAEITVSGELSEREYTNKEGVVVKTLSLRVNQNSYPSSKQDEQASPAKAQQPATVADDDDIPF
tara:strand:- start:761 stop:1141 length:381 start_codon:yes stop_codon:yes gene_type:complete